MTDGFFPVVYSALSSRALVEKVLNRYAIGQVTECQFWHRGLSDVYVVTAGEQQYILRVSHSHWRTQSDIEFELKLLDFLHQHCLPVAYPLRTEDGHLWLEINALEGKRYASLFIYAPGRVALGDMNPTQSYQLGETVAKVHQTAQNFCCQVDRQPLTLEYLLDDSFQVIAPFLQNKPDYLADLTHTINYIKFQLQDFPQEPPLWGICWGDPHSGNVHFTADNQITLFDFDQCGYGWRIFEIAKFLQVALQGGLSSKVRDAFISGYQSVEPLLEYEIAALQTFTQVAHIWAWAICLKHALLHDYSRLDDGFFQHRLAHLKMLRSPEWQLF